MTRIEDLVRSKFTNDAVIAVNISRDTDFDGDRTLGIEIIHADDVQIDPEDVIALTDELWAYLSAEADAPFPVTRFVSATDATHLNAA